MANKKTNQSSKKTTNNSKSTNVKSNAKAESRTVSFGENDAVKRIGSIIVFALSVLFFFLALIPG